MRNADPKMSAGKRIVIQVDPTSPAIGEVQIRRFQGDDWAYRVESVRHEAASGVVWGAGWTILDEYDDDMRDAEIEPHLVDGPLSVVAVKTIDGNVRTRSAGKHHRRSKDGATPLCGAKLGAPIYKPERWDPWNRRTVPAEECSKVWVPSMVEPDCKRCEKKVRRRCLAGGG